MQHDISPSKHGPHGEEMAAAVSTCVHCGFCLAACPTYQELGQEADSPRGRIVLMKEVLEGQLPVEAALPHIDPCLGCLACEPACPSGVPYRDLISPFRALVEADRKRSLGDRFRRTMAQWTLPFPGRFRLAAMTGRLAKPLAPWLPKSLRVMLNLLPDRLPPRQSWPELSPAVGKRRARVALLTGCAQSVLQPDINTATIDVLTRNGVEVLVPGRQSCCGALSWHVGNLAAAQAFAANNLRAFPADVDAVITNAAGCGSGMQEYHLIMKGTPDESLAQQFQNKIMDVAAFLDQLGDLAPLPETSRNASIAVAYHDACHLANAQGVKTAPRNLLRAIPGVNIKEIAASHLCCGSAGTYNLDHPEVADSLGAQKVDNILNTDPDVVATGNIGCLTQLALQMKRKGAAVPVRHTMQILRNAYAGRPIDQ
ncbi:MAG: 4Fe-4S dicluster domain-containing protein [Pirellulales bacterium]|nr:4Fe-4S dicluster domain-containing protein [Pirellulales bacterium]